MDWILDLLTQLGTTSNYTAIGDLHTLQTTVAKHYVFSSNQRLQKPFPGNGY
jgi:hypothetical protein